MNHSYGAGGAIKHEYRKTLGLEDFQGKLIIMNDEGESFIEIADWIEKNL
jgi:hypothetical protein